MIMPELPDPPEHVSLANVPDAVGKFRGIGGSLLLGAHNYTGDSDTDAGGRDLSQALRELEQDLIKDRLATLARLEEIYNDALQCEYQNMLVDHLPNPPAVRNPHAKCRPIVLFSTIDGSIDSVDVGR